MERRPINQHRKHPSFNENLWEGIFGPHTSPSAKSMGSIHQSFFKLFLHIAVTGLGTTTLNMEGGMERKSMEPIAVRKNG
jgi:hypothetical protein